MASSKPHLGRLKQQRKQLDARIQRLEAAEKSDERKKETRRKILVGAYVLGKARKENTLPLLFEQMDKFLSRESDRVLFDLPVLGADGMVKSDITGGEVKGDAVKGAGMGSGASLDEGTLKTDATLKEVLL